MSALPSIKEIAVHVSRTYADGNTVRFEATATSLQDAVVAAQFLLDGKEQASAPATTTVAKTEKPTTTAPPAAEGNAQASASASTQQSSQASASTAEKSCAAQTSAAGETPSLDYDKDVKPRVLRLAAEKGRDKTAAALARFGIKRATELDKDRWPEFTTFLDKVLNGEVDPEASVTEEAMA